MPEHLPEAMPEHLPEDMPEAMADRMPDRMPENMSDRMPEDLPVTKCINVMVGITRSKVILFFFEGSCGRIQLDILSSCHGQSAFASVASGNVSEQW
jgi:hypothetical protein